MILNNYKALIQVLLPNLLMGTGTDVNKSSSIPITNQEGISAYTYGSNILNKYGRTFGLVFGSGTTPPTPEDYILENEIGYSQIVDNNVKVTSSDVNYINETMVCSVLYTNNTDTEQTINEIALRFLYNDSNNFYLYSSPNSTSSTTAAFGKSGWVIFTRDVLDTPIIVSAGETKSIVYTIDFSKL